MSTVIGVDEARTHFSELLAQVERGDEITITRHGAPIAYLVPVHRKSTREKRRTAIAAIHQLAKKNRLAGLSIKELIAEGRK